MKFSRFFLFISVLFFSWHNLKAQSVILDWEDSISNDFLNCNGNYSGNALTYSQVIMDKSGNTYVCGYYAGTVSVTNSSGKNITISTSGDYDIFLAKYKPNGALEWINTKSPEDEIGSNPQIVMDKIGHIYLADETYENSDSFFVECYDTTGNNKWTTISRGFQVISLFTDSIGNCVLTSYTDSPASQQSYIYGDGIIIKLYALDAKGGIVFSDSYYSDDVSIADYSTVQTTIIQDNNNNTYVSGNCAEDITINGVKHNFTTNSLQHESYLVKYDAGYHIKWIKYLEDAEGDVYLPDISIDKDGEVFIAGNFISTYRKSSFLTIDSLSIPINDSINDNVYLASFDSTGKVRWAKGIGQSASILNGTGISGRSSYVDMAGNFYITGIFSGNALFGSIAEITNGYSDVFVAKYGSKGSIIWVKTANTNSSGFLILCSSTADENNNIYITGTFYDSAAFGNVTLNPNLSGFFTAKYDTSGRLAWANNYIDPFYFNNAIDFMHMGANSSNDVAITGGGIVCGNNTFSFLAKLSPCASSSPVLTSKGKLNYCFGDSINLNLKANVDTGIAITWIFMDTTVLNSKDTLLKVSSPGDYFFISTNKSGCQAVSNTIFVNVYPLPKALAGSNTSICPGASANIGDTPISGNTYSWTSKPVGYTSSSASARVSPATTTTYYITETTPGGGCSKSDSVIITLYPRLSSIAITLKGDTFNSNFKTGNQWYRNDTLIKGATNQKYVATESGNYFFSETDSNGCTFRCTPMNYTITGINQMADNLQLKIYPNPFTAQTTIEGTVDENSPVSLAIYDITGRLITTAVPRGAIPNARDGASNASQFTYTFDAQKYGCQSGVYFVKLMIGNEVVTREIVRLP